MGRRAKIVCTIGPASHGTRALARLLEAGMDVARLNFSHGTREGHRAVFDALRRLDGDVAIMQDLAGPKIRIGEMKGGQARLRDGDAFVLTTRDVPGDEKRSSVSLASLPASVRVGDSLFLADGIIHLEVVKVGPKDIHCRVVSGGVLTSRKGLNVPRLRVASSLSAKDRGDLEFGLAMGVDYVAVSFVRSAADVRRVKAVIRKRKSPALVVAKIEKAEALAHLEEIMEASDAIMVARGDLGVEIPPERVPVVQKEIIVRCRRMGKPVIVATQMLESMVGSERPTRAEASDVANATLDGADALMLSAETATGRYPAESVRMMDRIIREAESFRERLPQAETNGLFRASQGAVEAVCAAAVETALRIGARCIACLTHTGRTARLVARHRPLSMRIVALTASPAVVRRMGLVWGAESISVDLIEHTDEIFPLVKEKLRAMGIKGRVVLTAGIPVPEKGSTDTVHVVSI
jgi:pyruvate kinase